MGGACWGCAGTKWKSNCSWMQSQDRKIGAFSLIGLQPERGRWGSAYRIVARWAKKETPTLMRLISLTTRRRRRLLIPPRRSGKELTFTTKIVTMMKAEGLFESQGGPIILAQLEIMVFVGCYLNMCVEIMFVYKKSNPVHAARDIRGLLIWKNIWLRLGCMRARKRREVLGEIDQLTPSMAIYDTMHNLQSPVATQCVGYAYNLAGFLLADGEKGSRTAMPLCRITLQSPAGAARGQPMIFRMRQMSSFELETTCSGNWLKRRVNLLKSHCTGDGKADESDG